MKLTEDADKIDSSLDVEIEEINVEKITDHSYQSTKLVFGVSDKV